MLATVLERAPLALVSFGLVLAATTAPSCVDSRCTRDRECPVGQLCELATGTCWVPECTRHDDCAAGRVCDDFRCASGCRGDEDCPADHACVGLRCLPTGSPCDCALSPTFCAPDLNPRSATAGETVCTADLSSAAFVFGNVGCSHCKALLDAVLEVAGGLGAAAPVVFVQIDTIVVDAATVGSQFAAYDVPVVLDTAALDIYGSLQADWYHLVLVDSHGCLAGHWGPLAASAFTTPIGEEIDAAWVRAVSGACPASAD